MSDTRKYRKFTAQQKTEIVLASLEWLDSGERGWWRRWLGRDGWAAAERSVRALGVVVIDVDAQDAVELARADDQHPVQALGPVRSGRSARRVRGPVASATASGSP